MPDEQVVDSQDTGVQVVDSDATQQQEKSPIFYVKLNSSVGIILGVCAPKQFQLNLKDIVITGFNEECSFVTVVVYDPETEVIDKVVEEVIQNKRDLVLLNIQDFFTPPPPPQQEGNVLDDITEEPSA